MPPINVLIKPASSLCNMNCGYCFYHDEAENRNTKSYGFMRGDTLELIVQKTLAHASGHCAFGFQGGEPMLAGKAYFETVVALQKKYNQKNLTIHNSLQTNGVLIDDEWAAFFKQNGFLVGVSLDGNEGLHDLYRKDAHGSGTFAFVMRGIETLKKRKVDFNTLTVVTAQTAKQIGDVYKFFIRNGLVYQQYIPCLDPLDAAASTQRYSLTPQLYSRFLRELFDLWYKDRLKGKFVYNRYFENIAAILMGYAPESCDMQGVCSIQYAVEADGSVYPCDFYMLDTYCLGNIHENSMDEIDNNRKKTGFIERSQNLSDRCLHCKWLRICRGGCQRTRISTASDAAQSSMYCESLKEFYPYMLPKMLELIDRISR